MRRWAWDGLEENFRSRGRHVGVDVAERRIIEKAIAATDGSLSVAGQDASTLRIPCKSYARTKAVLRRWEDRESAHGKRNCLTVDWTGGITGGKRRACVGPKSGRRIRLTRNRNVVEQVRRLSIIRPCKSQVQGQSVADFPIVSTIDECVVLTEIERRISGSDLNPVWRVVKEPARVGKPKSTVKVGQEDVG